MDGKQAKCSFLLTLLVLNTFSFLPIDGKLVCPWCDESMQPRLLDCVYTGMISIPQLLMIPLHDIEGMKWRVASYSDSLTDMPYDVKKVKVDKMFVSEIANVMKENNLQNDPTMIDAVASLAGNCYSSVTGYDPSVVTRDVKAMIKSDISTDPQRGNTNSDPNSRKPYSAYQNQPSNFQPYTTQNLSPFNSAPFNSPLSSPLNFFDIPPLNIPSLSPVNIFHPSFLDNAPLIPPLRPTPVSYFNNSPFMNNAPFNLPGLSPIKSFDNPSSKNNDYFNRPGSPLTNYFDNSPFVSNVPSNPPVSSPINFSGNPPSKDKDSFNPPGSPGNYFNNLPSENNAPLNPTESSPVNFFNKLPFLNNAPTHPKSSKTNPSINPSFVNKASRPSRNWSSNDYDGQRQDSNNPSSVNKAYKPSRNWSSNDYDGQGQDSNNPSVNKASRPSNDYDGQGQDSNNPSSVNKASRSSKKRPSNNYGAEGQKKSHFSKNQAPSGGSPGSSHQNEKEFQDYKTSPENAAPFTTASPQISSTSEDSISTDFSENSNWVTPSPKNDASQKKPGSEKSDDDEQPCDEKFKIALYEKLINDNRFCTIFGKVPISYTKPEVPKIIKHAFKEYGVQQHFTEFSTFWRFESKTLNKESTVEDWAEVISKILKIIFSRNNLLKGDCEEAGKKMAGYILDTFPGDPAPSSTEKTNQSDKNDKSSTQPNSNSSDQKSKPASNSTANVSADINFNSGSTTDPGNLSFPELHSKLSNIFKHDKSTKKKDGKVPLSELLSAFETQKNLEKLLRAAESCLTSSGFDFNLFLTTMTEVADSIQKNHPDWSPDKCHKEMYSETVAVLTKVLQESMNAKCQLSSSQPDPAVDASDAQNTNFGAQPVLPNDHNLSPYDSTFPIQGNGFAPDSDPQQLPQPEVPNDYNLSPDYSTYPKQGTGFVPGSVLQPPAQPDTPYDYNLSSDDLTNSGPGTEFGSGSIPQAQQEFTNYGANGDKTGPVPSTGNQPGPGNWNDGLIQPSNFEPGSLSTNNGDLSNANSPNEPFSPPSDQIPPPQNYPVGPLSGPQQYSGTKPFQRNQNTGFQQSPNFAPDSGVIISPKVNFRNNQFPADNFSNDYSFNAVPSEAQPVVLNDNFQNSFNVGPSQALPDFRNNQFQTNNFGKDYNFNVGPSEALPVVPNDNSQNNFNSGSNSNYQNFQSLQDYNYGVPASGQNYNTQFQFNSNSGDAANGPVLRQW